MATSPHSKRSPAFQFYPDSFFGSAKVTDMSMTERGCYITLLGRCWQDNGLPTDLSHLARMCKMKTAQFERVWSGLLGQCFYERGGKFQNPRLDEEWKKQRDRSKRASDNASNRWNKDRGNAKSMQPHASGITESHCSREETETETASRNRDPKKKEEAAQFRADEAFRQLHKKYPQERVSSGNITERAFWDAIAEDPAYRFAQMLANLENNIQSHEWRVKGLIPSMQKWLSDGLWLRQLPSSPQAAESSGPQLPEWVRKARERKAAQS